MGVFHSRVIATFRFTEGKFILTTLAAVPRHCSCISCQWKEHCVVVSPDLGWEQGKCRLLLWHRGALHTHSHKEICKKMFFCHTELKDCPSRGRCSQIIRTVPWHTHWGLVIQHGPKSCRARAVARWQSSMCLLDWLLAMLAQNQTSQKCCQDLSRALLLADEDRWYGGELLLKNLYTQSKWQIYYSQNERRSS